MRRRAAATLAAGLLALSGGGAAAAGTLLDFSGDESAAILAHGPWPPPARHDASNRADGDAAAIALGRRLFFDAGLSRDGTVACASCHQPASAYQDGRRVARGLADGVRNTIGLLDAAGQRWYGWDGAYDSLWAASLRPLLEPAEMGSTPAAVAARMRANPALRSAWRRVFGAVPGDDQTVLVGAAKALAAWQATLVSPRTPFDRFRDALARGDAVAAARYPLAAQRGLRIFVGRGRCAVCHAGPRFTNGEFADIGVPFFVPGGVDSGRHGGLDRLRASPYNRLGRWADDGGAGAVATRHVVQQHRHFGEFKVPTLRGLAATAPYIHDGSLATLGDVVQWYDRLDESRLHADGERILRPLELGAEGRADLLAFLRTLSPERLSGRRMHPRRGGRRRRHRLPASRPFSAAA